jgi:hypothetical protein
VDKAKDGNFEVMNLKTHKPEKRFDQKASHNKFAFHFD